MGVNGQTARLRFGEFELDLEKGELRKKGRPVRLQPQPCKVLSALASRSGELVTRRPCVVTVSHEAEGKL